MEAIKPTITAIVLAKNEETLLPLCLTSVSWADEIIVVDNGSTDRTVDVAKKYKARIIHDDAADFSHLREAAQKKATGSWLLYIDADEEVTPKLRDEIVSTVQSFDAVGDPVAYTIKRTNFYLGHPWPHVDGMMRLFVASALSGWQGSLHETAMVNGTVGELGERLIHRTHRTLEEMVAKTNVWSEEEAKLRFTAGHPPVVAWRLMRVMGTAFWQSFVAQGGWRSGTVGWIESVYQAFSMFITYAKLWERQRSNN